MTKAVSIKTLVASMAAMVTVTSSAWAKEGDTPQLIAPRTRPEVKKAVEDQKEATPRIPLPPLEAGEMPGANNGRMQRYYLPEQWRTTRFWGARGASAGGRRSAVPASPRDVFGVEMFWIVSRTNDCRYCLGHQEVKLATSGVSEERIARLDGDWAGFTPADRAGLAYARKITLEPHKVGRADIEELRKHFAEPQIVEIVLKNAGYNRTNRWTGSLNIPQDKEPFGQSGSLATPTSDEFAEKDSTIMPLKGIARPPLESRADVEKRIAEASKRQPYVAVPAASENIPTWAALYGPEQAADQAKSFKAIFTTGKLPPLLKAQIAWVSARNNRAWSALGTARDRLASLGQSDDAIFALDCETNSALSPAQREALAFAKKLTIYPQIMDDQDFARLRPLFSNHEIAELVYVTGSANFFDRVTEPLGLPIQ